MALLNGRSCGAFGIAAVLAAAVSAAHAATGLEDAVQATYTYKFAPFVSWPQSAHAAAAFSICVHGNDNVTSLLPDATAGQQMGGKPIVVRKVGDGDSLDDCRILYVAASPDADSVLAAAQGKPILTVSGVYGAQHGIVRFLLVDRHVRFDIDDSLAQTAGLTISSKLLDLAHAVKTGESRP